VLVAFGHHVPYALFCEWLQQWLGTQALSATMHNHVCEGFYVVVCDREGASDIAAPGLKDYLHMRPAIFSHSVDLFTSSKHNMVATLSLSLVFLSSFITVFPPLQVNWVCLLGTLE
jgi:hypothetical protein